MFPPYVSHLHYLKTVFIAQNKVTHLISYLREEVAAVIRLRINYS